MGNDKDFFKTVLTAVMQGRSDLWGAHTGNERCNLEVMVPNVSTDTVNVGGLLVLADKKRVPNRAQDTQCGPTSRVWKTQIRVQHCTLGSQGMGDGRSWACDHRA